MKLGFMGAGYVGLVSAACFADHGNEIVLYDIDREKIEKIKRGETPIFEPGLSDLLERGIARGNIRATTDIGELGKHAQIAFIAVGTPESSDRSAYLGYVREAVNELVNNKKEFGDACPLEIIVMKSTVPCGTGRAFRAELKDVSLEYASVPEFLAQGSAVENTQRPDRVVIGCEDERTGEILRELHEPFVRTGNPILVMDITSAELSKYAINGALAARISYMNEIAELAQKSGANIDSVRRVVGSDKRIGPNFLFPGIGFGGSCFPKDVKALEYAAEHLGIEPFMIQAVYNRNIRMASNFDTRISNYYGGSVKGKIFAVWGLTFKPNTDDMREAPSIRVISSLEGSGADIRAHDPVAVSKGTAQRAFDIREKVTFTDDKYAALQGADGLVICTEWKEYDNPDFDRIKRELKTPVIFDGRNMYNPEAMRRRGFDYLSIGRPDVIQSK